MGHAWEKWDACRILVWKAWGNLLLIRATLTYKGDIKIGIKETGWCDVMWAGLMVLRIGAVGGLFRTRQCIFISGSVGQFYQLRSCGTRCVGAAEWWAEAGISMCVCMRARWGDYRLLVGLMNCSLTFWIILKTTLVENLAFPGNFLSMSRPVVYRGIVGKCESSNLSHAFTMHASA